MMSLYTLFIVAFALFASVFAAPLNLEKRITHSGRVSILVVSISVPGADLVFVI